MYCVTGGDPLLGVLPVTGSIRGGGYPLDPPLGCGVLSSSEEGVHPRGSFVLPRPQISIVLLYFRARVKKESRNLPFGGPKGVATTVQDYPLKGPFRGYQGW